MDRRTKFILLIVGSVLLLGLVFWFIVLPLIRPVLPVILPAQPPPLGAPEPPVVNIPTSPEPAESAVVPTPRTPIGLEVIPNLTPDEERIQELMARAGALSERVESGSSSNEFQNFEDAALDVGAGLAADFLAMRDSLIEAHPAAGPSYLTIARRLIEIPESRAVIAGDTFTVRVQMQLEIRESTATRTEMKESTVTFSLMNDEWIETGYESAPFEP